MRYYCYVSAVPSCSSCGAHCYVAAVPSYSSCGTHRLENVTLTSIVRPAEQDRGSNKFLYEDLVEVVQRINSPH